MVYVCCGYWSSLRWVGQQTMKRYIKGLTPAPIKPEPAKGSSGWPEKICGNCAYYENGHADTCRCFDSFWFNNTMRSTATCQHHVYSMNRLIDGPACHLCTYWKKQKEEHIRGACTNDASPYCNMETYDHFDCPGFMRRRTWNGILKTSVRSGRWRDLWHL